MAVKLLLGETMTTTNIMSFVSVYLAAQKCASFCVFIF